MIATFLSGGQSINARVVAPGMNEIYTAELKYRSYSHEPSSMHVSSLIGVARRLISGSARRHLLSSEKLLFREGELAHF